MTTVPTSSGQQQASKFTASVNSAALTSAPQEPVTKSGDYVAVYQLDETVDASASRAASAGGRLGKDVWETLAALRLVREARGHEPDLTRALNRLVNAKVFKLAAVCDPVEGAKTYSRSPMVAAYWMT